MQTRNLQVQEQVDSGVLQERCRHIDHVVRLTLEYYSHGGRSVEPVRAKIFFGPDVMYLKCANPLVLDAPFEHSNWSKRVTRHTKVRIERNSTVILKLEVYHTWLCALSRHSPAQFHE